jgi:glycine betaine catabolism B
MLHLQIIHPQSGTIVAQEFDLKQDFHRLIGRHPSCPIYLDRPEVSRIHGQFAWVDAVLTYSDLGSTDGSKINNQPIAINQPQILRSGDSLQIGEYILLVGAIDVATHSAPPITLRCIQVIDQTPNVKTFRWVADTTFDYLPGQFVTFQVTIGGQTVTRCYSISSSPSRPEILEFTVKRVGLVSNWLHETVGLGFELPILGIAGEFTCGGKGTSVPDKLLLLSAGSGITPMLSIVRWLCDMAYPTDIILLHTVRGSADIIARSELAWLASLNPRLHLRFTVTQPEANWSGLAGRVDAAMLQGIADLRDRHVYVCGPDAFMAGMKETLLQLGLPASQYQEESFGGPPTIGVAKPTSPETNDVIGNVIGNVIEFAQSKKMIRPQAGESILDAGLRSGLKLKQGCRMGVCGVCKLKRQSGQVNYSRSPSGLQGDTSAFVLPCVACAVDRVVLEA